MIKDIKNKVIVLAVVAGFLTIGTMAFKLPPAPAPGEGFKNLQILPKDISKDSLVKVMRSYSTALGVKCGFCHAASKDTSNHHPDFASDDKPEKGAARHMMKMTADINANYFNWNNSTRTDTIHVVACITCHRGIAQPDMKNIMAQLQMSSQPAAPQTPPAPPNGK